MKLHEVVAVRKGIKARTYSDLTQLHKTAQKADQFAGLERAYQPLDEEGEQFPPESKIVQLTVRDLLAKVRAVLAESWGIELDQEAGNHTATADIVVDGNTVMTDAPVTFLIYAEKQLTDLRTMADALPVLETAKRWEADPNSHLFRTAEAVTGKTKKVQRPIVLYDATEEHPAQTQLITEDITIGHWHSTYYSGAIPQPTKDALTARIDGLKDAVKQARARANEAEVDRGNDVDGMLTHLFTFLFPE